MNHSKHFLITILTLATLIQSSASFAQAVPKKNEPAVVSKVETPAVPSPSPSVAPSPEVVAAPVIAEPASTSQPSRYGKENRLLGDFLVGPYATVLAAPRPISFGLEAKYSDLIGFSGGYGFFPQITFSGVKVKLNGWDVRAKIYPFKGAFFVGVGFGSQNLAGSKTEVVSGQSATAEVDQDNTFVAPHIGWNWIWGSGFFMGVDLGVQLSLGRTTRFNTNVTNATVLASADYANLRKDVLDNAEKIGKTPLPLLTLLKVGYFF